MAGMIKKKEGEDSWVTYIKKRVDHNLNFLNITTGGPGKAKTYSDIAIACKIDPDFDPDLQIAFDFPQIMDMINRFNGTDTDYLEDKPEGYVPLHKRKYKIGIAEEFQVTANARNWQSKINKFLLYLMSTFRHQNIILFINAPYQDYLDSASMKLIHSRFEAIGFDKKKKKSYLRPVLLQYNGKLSKFYEHNLRVIHNGRVRKFAGLWALDKAPQHILDRYEELKSNFTNELNAKLTAEAKMETEKSKQTSATTQIDTRKALTEKQEYTLKALAEGKSYDYLAQKEGINKSVISARVKFARLKGWHVKDFKEETNE